MDKHIEEKVDNLLSQKKINYKEALEVLREFSLEMLKDRDAYLKRSEYRKVRQFHDDMACLYERAGEKVPEEHREHFSFMAYYWSTTGNNLWEPSPPPMRVEPIKARGIFPERRHFWTLTTDDEYSEPLPTIRKLPATTQPPQFGTGHRFQLDPKTIPRTTDPKAPSWLQATPDNMRAELLKTPEVVGLISFTFDLIITTPLTIRTLSPATTLSTVSPYTIPFRAVTGAS